jgi:hypothetical protein
MAKTQWQEYRIDALPDTTQNEIAWLLGRDTRDELFPDISDFNTPRGTQRQRVYLSSDLGELNQGAFLIVWNPQGATIGSWVAIHRDNDTKELKLWPEKPYTRENYRLSPAEKRKVDRHGRIAKKAHMQTLIARNSLLPFPDLQEFPVVIPSGEEGILLDPEIFGYPVISEENYIINYNTIMSRSFLNRS